MTEHERVALRLAIIAGATDCALTVEEAAIFMGIGVTKLRELNVPRADIGGTKYLKSECLKFVATRLTHRILDGRAA